MGGSAKLCSSQKGLQEGEKEEKRRGKHRATRGGGIPLFKPGAKLQNMCIHLQEHQNKPVIQRNPRGILHVEMTSESAVCEINAHV